MLTGPLVRARVAGPTIAPSLVAPTKKALREQAEALVDLFHSATEARWTRGELGEAIDDLVADRSDHKLLRGMAKVLLDRARFDEASGVDPVALRREVFLASRQVGPLALTRDVLDRPVAADVLTTVGARHELGPDQVAALLYADRPDEHRLGAWQVPDAEWLVLRYNVALVQALLLKASEVRIRLKAPTVPRVRQLFRHVKFYQLLHVARWDGDVLEIRLDGPGAILRQSTRYGLQLASFFPALLLQQGRWWMEATVLWTKAQHRKRMTLSSEDGLVSHYRDHGAYEPQVHQWFRERWAKKERAWELSDRTEPIDLGGYALVLPDFRFSKDGRHAQLEIIGFWRRDYLERRLQWLAEYGPGNLVLAVSRKLLAGKEDLPDFDGPVVPFSEVVPVDKVLDALETAAR